jgi:DNA (cytosine-5)-methyltransferase 1
MREFTFIDLFAGLGGFHVAAERLGGRCVYASEINETLCGIYEKNFGIRPAGDIRDVDVEGIPAHDLLCAGFPCQPFSKAGEQMGWKDKKRGTVFWKIMEIIRRHSPRLVLLENVAHFVRHDSGNTYRKVKQALEAEGYSVDHRQFSPHQFGVPQIRERIYMVAVRGSLRGHRWPDFAGGESATIHSVLDRTPEEAAPLSRRVVQCLKVWQKFLKCLPEPIKLPSFPIWAMEFGATYPYDGDNLEDKPLSKLQKLRGCFGEPLKGLSREAIFAAVPSHARGSGVVFPDWKKAFIRQNREFYKEHRQLLEDWLPAIREFPSSLQKFEWNCQGEERDLWKLVIQFRASGVRVKRATTAPSLVAMTTTQVPIIGWEKRYMTVRECARLQSLEVLKHFPEGGQAFQALGNAVNTKVVKAVLQGMLALLPTGKAKVTKSVARGLAE